MSFMSAVDSYLGGSTAGLTQRQEITEAAQTIDAVPGEEMRKGLQRAFWAWLQNGRWQQSHLPPESRLEARSREDKEAIEENYRTMYPRFDYGKASEMAVRNRSMRVSRCARELNTGKTVEECLCFVYAKDELQEAMSKTRGQRAA